MSERFPRVLCICLFRRNDSILVAEGRDRARAETFYRPLGGTMEFGERGFETVAREIKEEIGATVKNTRFLGTIENLFTLEGKPEHEIVLVFDGELTDSTLYDKKLIEGRDEWPGGSISFKAMWKPIERFRKREMPLYPEGLIELIDKNLSISPAAV